MNLDCNSQHVISKYFTNNAMDESLSDFQETKQYCKGPVVKQIAKSKVRKGVKHIKGQKDIRTVLKKKKDDLITYTKAFDSVCKKSGLDVDSEQLQIAIALSKSLQTENSDASISKPIPREGRLARIKTTLKEYGFRVPDIKICTNKGKKGKKKYQLITTTNEERNQKVTSKYSQVLFECLDSSRISCFYEESVAPAFNIATNLTYEFMKDTNIFYVDNLIEKATTDGCLLKNWADIPGRPLSPIFESFDKSLIDFTKMACSQNDLDVVLSGTIKTAQNVIATKYLQNRNENAECSYSKVFTANEDTAIKHQNNINNTIRSDRETIKVIKELINSNDKDAINKEAIDLESTAALPDMEQHRCCSPDLFDDEESSIVDISKPIVLTPAQKTKIFVDEINYMDLTECVGDLYQNINKVQISLQNFTTRKSNDFMEITQCAANLSQGFQDNVREMSLKKCPEGKSNRIANHKVETVGVSVDINFTQNKDNIEKADLGSKDAKYTFAGNIKDMSEHSYRNNSIILEDYHSTLNSIDHKKEIKIVNSLDAVQGKYNIDLTQSYNKEENRLTIIKEKGGLNDKCIDLTEASGINVNLDDVKLCYSQDNYTNLDNTIILKEDEYNVIHSNPNIFNNVQDGQILDLTQVVDGSTEQSSQERTIQYSKSFYDDFVHDHSNSQENVCNTGLNNDNCSIHNTSNEIDGIDLTQSSDESSSTTSVKSPTFKSIPKSSNLGKRHDDISIDYDEIFEHRNDNEGGNNSKNLNIDKFTLNIKYDSSKSQISDDKEQLNGNNDVSNSSQNDEMFDLMDKELNYSINKSRYEMPIDDYNFDLGGISALDNISEWRYEKFSDCKNSSLRTNVISGNEITNSEEPGVHKLNTSSPSNHQNINETNNGLISIETPNNSEYMIKTNEVTPMLNYETMTTPQRNKELDKYGLRPFKRKRAIQILTHLYNQTHPKIESYVDDEQPSPKKLREDNNPSYSLPKEPNITTDLQLEIGVIKSPTKLVKDNKSVKSPVKDTMCRKFKSPQKGNRKENSPRKRQETDTENIVCVYEITSEVPVIKSVDCSPDDWVFQKKEKAKIHSCRVPLHIAFHNYVSSRRGLREAILKYEPVNIDIIHKDLVSYGHRYDPKDLLRFLDKKCITVKTADNNARNKR